MNQGQKAWLLRWEWIGPHAAVEDRIAAILRPRLSIRIVGELVECLYAIHEYSPTELAHWSKRPKDNPYKAKWYNGDCFCGHNPSLHANYVHKLVVERNPETGLETISWSVPPRYRLNNETGRMDQVRGEMRESTTRTITGPLSAREIGRYCQNEPERD